MQRIRPFLYATFDLTGRYNAAGHLIWRATCEVPGCPVYVEADDKRIALQDGHRHRRAHVKGGRKFHAVVAATLRSAA